MNRLSGPVPVGRSGQPDPELSKLYVTIGGAIVVVVLLAGLAGLFLWRRASVVDHPRAFHAYYPRANDVHVGTTTVTYRSHEVGEVTAVRPNRLALQITVLPDDPAAWAFVCTLEPGAALRDDGVTVQLTTLTTLDVTTPEGAAQFERRPLVGDRGIGWQVTAADSTTGLWVSGVPLRVTPATRATVVRPGDEVRYGDRRLQWRDVQRYHRVEGAVDSVALHRLAAADGADTVRILGAGSSVAIASTFGLTRASLQLEPSFGPEPRCADGASLELTPFDVLDLQSIAQGAARFLLSPSAADLPPRNRFERLVADANATFTELARTSARLGNVAGRIDSVSSIDGGRGALGRLALGRGYTNLQALLRSGVGVANQIDTLLAAVGTDPGAVQRLVLNADQTASLDSALAAFAGLAARLSDEEQSLLDAIAGPELSYDLATTLDDVRESWRSSLTGVRRSAGDAFDNVGSVAGPAKATLVLTAALVVAKLLSVVGLF